MGCAQEALECRMRCESGKGWKGARLGFATAAKDGGTMLRFAHAGW
jgi:hypothetical protein